MGCKTACRGIKKQVKAAITAHHVIKKKTGCIEENQQSHQLMWGGFEIGWFSKDCELSWISEACQNDHQSAEFMKGYLIVSVAYRLPFVQQSRKGFKVCRHCFSCRFILHASGNTQCWPGPGSAAVLCLNFERFHFPNERTLYAAHVPSQTWSFSPWVSGNWGSPEV